MENPSNRVAEHQRRALDFMLDSLGLRHAHDELVRRAPAGLSLQGSRNQPSRPLFNHDSV